MFCASFSLQHQQTVLERWMNGSCNVLVTTIACGMVITCMSLMFNYIQGINKPDVRMIIHWYCPKTASAYYQESGRAGRDGKAAKCILYFNQKDLRHVDQVMNHFATAA